MTFERKPGEFSLFKNTNKSSDKAPDYTGEGLDLSGGKIRVAAWRKTDKNGYPWLSCKFERPRAEAETPVDV